MERVPTEGLPTLRVLSCLEQGLAKGRSDCLNADGAAVVAGAAQYDSPPASPSYPLQPSPDHSDDSDSGEAHFATTLITLRAELIADHMVAMVALDELFAGIDIVVAQLNDARTQAPAATEGDNAVGQIGPSQHVASAADSPSASPSGSHGAPVTTI